MSATEVTNLANSTASAITDDPMSSFTCDTACWAENFFISLFGMVPSILCTNAA